MIGVERTDFVGIPVTDMISVGDVRRTRGQRLHVLTVGAAESAP